MLSHCRDGTASERIRPTPAMNGAQKSDTGVVAMKSSNKGTRVPAETMERRTVPEGNPDGQSTHQAQDWESVSQAIGRIRQFARLVVSSTQGRSRMP